MRSANPSLPSIAALAAAAFLLVACDKSVPPSENSSKSSSFSSQVESASKKVESAAEDAAGKTKDAMTTAGDKIETAAVKAKSEASDSAITVAVKSKFVSDQDLKAVDIHVDTQGGTVTLNGTVDSDRNRDKAAEVARAVDGVKSVSNRLLVARK